MKCLMKYFAVAVLLLISGSEANAQTCSGCLDASFGSGGLVTTTVNYSTGKNWANSIAVQPLDGKIVVAAYGHNYPAGTGRDFYLVRYNPDGSMDQNFGLGGVARVSFATDSETPYAVGLQSDGKIVVGGSASVGFAVARLHTDGSIDTSFGSNGKTEFKFSSKESAGLRAIAIQPDDRIVLAGNTANNFAFARLTAQGVLDSSFNVTGKLTVSTAKSTDTVGGATSLALQTDGKIVAAGRRSSLRGVGRDFAVMRINTNGTLDSSFGSSGQVFTDFTGLNDEALDVTIDQSGKIVAGGETRFGSGSTDYRFAVVRYNSNGTLDSSFGAGGKSAFGITGYGSVLRSIGIQADAKIVGAGRVRNSDGTVVDFAVIRLNSDGSLDTSFGMSATGIVTTHILGQDEGHCFAFQSDGKIVTAGLAASGDYIAIARYLP